MSEIFKITSISHFHKIIGLPSPEHPLVSLIDESNRNEKRDLDEKFFDLRFTTDLYAIMFKDSISGSLGYGRTTYDFQEGSVIFTSPGQVFAPPTREEAEMLLRGK